MGQSTIKNRTLRPFTPSAPTPTTGVPTGVNFGINACKPRRMAARSLRWAAASRMPKDSSRLDGTKLLALAARKILAWGVRL